MNTIKDALVEKFKDVFGYDPGDVYETRIRNARSVICQEKYDEEDMIEIWDTSIFSNGKSGLVLTVDSVCVNASENFTSKFIAKYADIDYMHIEEDSFLGIDTSSLDLEMKYGVTYQISLEDFDKEDMKEFLTYAMSLYTETVELEG